MDKKLYKLMNWPLIEEIVYSESSDPHRILGVQKAGSSSLVQAFFPAHYVCLFKAAGFRIAQGFLDHFAGQTLPPEGFFYKYKTDERRKIISVRKLIFSDKCAEAGDIAVDPRGKNPLPGQKTAGSHNIGQLWAGAPGALLRKSKGFLPQGMILRHGEYFGHAGYSFPFSSQVLKESKREYYTGKRKTDQ